MLFYIDTRRMAQHIYIALIHKMFIYVLYTALQITILTKAKVLLLWVYSFLVFMFVSVTTFFKLQEAKKENGFRSQLNYWHRLGLLTFWKCSRPRTAEPSPVTDEPYGHVCALTSILLSELTCTETAIITVTFFIVFIQKWILVTANRKTTPKL